MNILDFRTVFFLYLVTCFVGLVVSGILWIQAHRTFRELWLFVCDYLFQIAALSLVFLRGYIPDFLSIDVSNTLVLAGSIIRLEGLARFWGFRPNQIYNLIFLVVFFVVHTWFTFGVPSLEFRTINTSVGIFVISLQIALMAFKVKQHARIRIAWGIGLIFTIYSIISIIRIFKLQVWGLPSDDFLEGDSFEIFVIIVYCVLFMLFTYFLVLMINERLLNDLKIQHEKFYKAFHSSPSAILLTGLENGKIIEVNGNFASMTGYENNEVIGKTSLEIGLWELESARSLFVDILTDKGIVKDKEYRFRRKDGEIFYGLISSEIIQINEENLLISTITDISLRKKIEEDLIQSEAKFRILLEESTDPIFSFSANGRYLYVNKAFANGVGKMPEEIINKTIWDVFPPGEARKRVAALTEVIESGIEKVIEVKVHSHGADSYYLTTISPIKNRQGTVETVICSSKNITERKATEEKLENYALQLTIANDTKDKFFSIIAHDLKGPVNVILGFSELLAEKLVRYKNRAIKEYAEIVQTTAIQTARLLDNLLEWARLQKGNIPFEPEFVNLNEIVADINILMREVALKKQVTIEAFIPNQLVVFADTNMINTVLRNLISNAIKYSSTGGKVVVEATEQEDLVEISVIDRGVGISEEIRSTLFKQGLKSSNPGTANERGTGLGLILCKEFVDQLGGRIWVDSGLGAGSTFYFTVPIKNRAIN